MLADAGVTKSAGSTAAYMPYAVGLAEAVVSVEKLLKRTVREMDRHADRVGRMIDANGERIRQLAELHDAAGQPVVPSARGMVDLDARRFGVGLVDLEQAPRTMNGHSSHGEGLAPASPPLWHPENDGGV